MRNITFELTEREANRLFQDLLNQLVNEHNPIYITIPESSIRGIGVDYGQVDT